MGGHQHCVVQLYANSHGGRCRHHSNLWVNEFPLSGLISSEFDETQWCVFDHPSLVFRTSYIDLGCRGLVF